MPSTHRPSGRAAVLCGLGSYLPPNAVPNSALPAELGTSDEWIRTRTGIGCRYFASPGTKTSDLAVRAGAAALASARARHADAVIVATTTPDRPCPATGPTVAARLGLTGAAAFDVSAVCTGFIYALASGAGLVASGTADQVLVIGAETYSSIIDPHDRSTAVIFGDGAGAVLLRAGEPDEPGAVGPFNLGSDGSGADLITVRAGGSEQRLSGVAPRRADTFFSMDVRDVFWNAVTRMAESSTAVLDQAGWATEEVDHFVGHQANSRILNCIADKLGIARERSITNIAEVGNTSAASIPLALDQAWHAGRLVAGSRVLLTAFGGGLTWGSAVLTWPALESAQARNESSPHSIEESAS